MQSGTPRFAIGTQFIPLSNKANCVYTVTDIWQTFNSRGELVGLEYLCEHSLCGQSMTSRECETTIARGIANMATVTVRLNKGLGSNRQPTA